MLRSLYRVLILKHVQIQVKIEISAKIKIDLCRQHLFGILNSIMNTSKIDFPLLDRHLDDKVHQALKDYIELISNGANCSISWTSFYKFIISAYAVKQDRRPSVSQLANIFKKYGFDNPGSLAVLYAHSLYILAVHDQLKIYGNDFNP